MSVSRGDAADRTSVQVGVHEDQTILVAAQKAGGFSIYLVKLGPGTLMKLESLSARAGTVNDVDNGNSGFERAGPPSGGPVRSIWKNIDLPVVEVRRTRTGRRARILNRTAKDWR